MPVDFNHPNIMTAWNRFRQLGYTPVQAAGLMGRLVNESGSKLNTGSVGDSGVSHNIGQWNGSRWTNFQNFAKSNGLDPNNVDTGARFIDWELKNKEGTAYNLLKKAQTPQEAANAAMAYERPKNWSLADPSAGSGYASTVRDSNNIFSKLGSAPMSSGLPASVPQASGTIGSTFLSPGVSGGATPDTSSSPNTTPATAGGTTPPATGPLASNESPLIDKTTSDLFTKAMQGGGGGSLINESGGGGGAASMGAANANRSSMAAQLMAKYMGNQPLLAAPVMPAQSFIQGFRPGQMPTNNLGGAPGLMSGFGYVS